MTTIETRLFGLLATIWGGVLIYFYASLRVNKYLAENFHLFVLVGGIGICILGVYSMISPKDKTSETHSCHGHDHHDHDAHDHDHSHSHCDHDHSGHETCQHDHDHDHDHGESCDGHHHHDEGHGLATTYLLTLVPLIIAMTFTKDRFSDLGLARQGAYEAPPESRAPFTREDLEKNVPKNAQGEFQLSLVNAYYAGGDKELHDVLDGLPVEIQGRLMPEKVNNQDGMRRRIFRTFISCCAADATVAGVSLLFDTPTPDPPNQTWVKAHGKLTFEEHQGRSYTVVKVSSLEAAEEPYSEFIQRNR